MSNENAPKILEFARQSTPLYSENMALLKAMLVSPEQASKQRDGEVGEQPWPVCMLTLGKLKTSSPHHETCINTKKAAIVGLGFRNEFDRQMLAFKQNPTSAKPPTADPDEVSKAYLLLSELVDGSLKTLLEDTCEDWSNTGNAYWEVVRDRSGKISAIWHIPARQMVVYINSEGMTDRHYVYRPDAGSEKVFARFGDKDRLISTKKLTVNPEQVSEVVHFRRANSKSRYYGIPDWMSAIPAIELAQMVHQQQFDFFKNRGVPEFMALFLGTSLPAKVWEKIEEAMRANIGSGNSHKSIALNIQDPNMKVQIEKLGLDTANENSFEALNSVLASEIVSAHRVPPLLAGLHVPGKMGSTNELPNSLMAFQSLYVDQDQLTFSETIAATVGKELGLGLHDVTFRKLTDKFDISQMDTISRMRDQLASPSGQARNPADGLKKSEDGPEVTPEQIGKVLAKLYQLVR